MDSAKSGRCYKKITIHGIVQGVGFRPSVFRLAQKYKVLGTVKNTGGSVEICASAEENKLKLFIDAIKNSQIPFAHIEKMKIETTGYFVSDDFKIIVSENNSLDECFILPDLPVCEKCIGELKDNKNRRNNHYFNTCVSCGPRFSIIEKLPYDRENTSMHDFTICKACCDEYTSPDNRRFHAETISCNDCGPELLYRTNNKTYTKDDAFLRAAGALKDGGIIAIKGIGGYHFACSPFEREAVISLRKLKGRDQKPFAVMFKDLDEIKKVCEISIYEQELLTSNPRPITILEIKTDPFVPEVLFGDLRSGCFLPYTPLHHMLMQHMGQLVMTSANISGAPIIKDDHEILALLNGTNEKLIGVLYHPRRIVRSIEDSVANVVDNGQVQIIRRARGYVPTPFYLNNIKNRPFLAMGGDLKASFCLVKNNNAYISQYFGDLEDLGVHKNYTSSIDEYKMLFNVEPEFVLCDMHPHYFSSIYAKSLGIPSIQVQHHHAHIASVMAEHNIHDRVIGVAFDGSGFGEDGNIWGGEFLICENESYQRAGHLKYTKILGADSSARDAVKTAACFLDDCGVKDVEAFDSRINVIRPALLKNINAVQSSSMGRLFDAAAAILGIGSENCYEGMCAALLQRSAENACRSKVKPYFMEFSIEQENDEILIGHHDIIKLIYKKSHLNKNSQSGSFALGFHIAVANMVNDVCKRLREKENINKIALSGGVFQNSFLLNLCMNLLKDSGFKVFINNLVPPNDGGIAFGQAYIGAGQGRFFEHVHSRSNESNPDRQRE